jgi:hypothetical protein
MARAGEIQTTIPLTITTAMALLIWLTSAYLAIGSVKPDACSYLKGVFSWLDVLNQDQQRR